MPDITITKFTNGCKYRMLNKRLGIIKIADDTFTIETKTLLVLTDEEKEDYIKCDGPGTILVHRNHSKYAVWHNQISFSRMVFECFFTFWDDIDQLKVIEKQKND